MLLVAGLWLARKACKPNVAAFQVHVVTILSNKIRYDLYQGGNVLPRFIYW